MWSNFSRLLAALLFFGFVGVQIEGQGQDQERLRREEAEDYYKRWLDQDVTLVITDEERAVFQNLTSQDEKESFIEQFWQRRDPSPDTIENEYREEHYRRIAYANDHFSSGIPGWKTDRGRVYIINGPPDTIESHAAGEQYYRPMTEGGGVTTTYAWELWYYRHIPGIEDPVEVEFVDRSMTGNYVLARDEMDKDAMLWVPGLGLTESERFGGATKGERIGTRTMANEATRRVGNPLKIFTRKDDLFERLRRYDKIQAAPTIKFEDLEGIVDINLYYNKLPFTVRHDLIKVTQTDYLVPVTYYFEKKEFSYKQSGTIQQAVVNVYGRVENMTKEKVYSFDDTVYLTLAAEMQDLSSDYAVYQRSIPLNPGRFKLVAIVKDVNGEKIGTLERGIIIPGDTNEQLELSPIILADKVQPAKSEEFITDPFVLAGVKVYPSPDNNFVRGRPLGFYFEVYNVMADQQTLEPSLSFGMKIDRDGKPVPTPFDGKDLSQLLHRYSDRFFAGSMLNTEPLEPGRYNLVISVTDNIAQSTSERSISFQVLPKAG